MEITAARAQVAFAAHFQHYANRKVAWDISHHAQMWDLGIQAFDESSEDAFGNLYGNLHRHWQAFRPLPIERCWSAGTIYECLRGCPASLRSVRLTTLTPEDWPTIVEVLQRIAGLKPTASPSVVAVSKFLHFWNPNLFVIVDRGEMWQKTLRHPDLRKSFAQARGQFPASCSQIRGWCPGDGFGLYNYVRILGWLSGLLSQNPAIQEAYGAYLGVHLPQHARLAVIQQYEAVAAEWFLLGFAQETPGPRTCGDSAIVTS